jgi:hypothetical protein
MNHQEAAASEVRPAAVYRLWAADGTLLYVGSSYAAAAFPDKVTPALVEQSEAIAARLAAEVRDLTWEGRRRRIARELRR